KSSDGVRLAGVEVFPGHDDMVPVAGLPADLRHADHRRRRVAFLDLLAARRDDRECPVPQVARLGIVEIEPEPAVVGAELRDLDWIAETRLEQLVRVGVAPEREAAAPAVVLVSEIALGGEEDPAV